MRIRPSAAIGALAVTLAIGFAPAYADDANREARTLLQNEQHERALSAADKLIAGNPANAEARFLRGVALAELGRSTEAIATFRKLTEDFPSLPEPYNNLAVLYARQRDFDKARDALEQAIRTHPSYATAHSNLGDLYARLANEAYERALQLDAGRDTKRPTQTRPQLALIHTLGPAAQAPLVLAEARPAARPAPAPTPTPAAPPIAAVQPAQPVAATPAPSVPRSEPTVAATSAGPAAPIKQPAAEPARPTPAPAVAKEPTEPKVDTAAAKPVTTQPPAAAGEVLAAVQAWAAAWSSKNVDAYLDAYDKDFEVPGGRSRSAWENERRQRIGKPGEISVEIDNPQVTVDGNRAEVRFRQHYRSSNFNASTVKILEMVRRGQRWQIAQEKIGR
jgi:Flp pilus assembly protein TadD